MKTSPSEKLCSTCNLIKPISEYYKNRNSYAKHCKKCYLIINNKSRKLRILNTPKNEDINIKDLWSYFEDGAEQEIHKYVMEVIIPELNEIYFKIGRKS